MRTLIVSGLLAGLICLAGAGCSSESRGSTGGGGKKKGKGGEGGPVPVSVAKVEQKNVPVDVQVVGNAEAYTTITVKAQVGGELTEVHFKEGDYIAKGALLFTIDPRPMEARLHQEEANLARDEAQLGQAEANLQKDLAMQKYIESQTQRSIQLAEQGIISKDQVEQQRSNLDAHAQTIKADLATIESAKAAVVAQKATIETVRLQLSYTVIRSPIDGRTGNLAIKKGNIVAPNTTDLITINQVQPIYVTFSVPEGQLADVKKYLARGNVPVLVTPQDEPNTTLTGELSFVDNTVDTSTGTIRLKGTFANADRRIWPGEFLRVVLRLTTQAGALVVPNQAVQTGQDGSFVYVVKEDRSVESRPVVTGARVNDDLVVDKGLQLGEVVVTEGQFRLAPGSRIQLRGEGEGPGGGRGKKKKDEGT
jgi:membrane fusion protein, multidrug efflux system